MNPIIGAVIAIALLIGAAIWALVDIINEIGKMGE